MRTLPVAWALAGLLVVGAAHAFLWPSQIDRVERQLRDDDVATRRSAAQQLRRLPAGVSAELALIALADPDAEVRLAAVEIAVLRQPDRAVPIVLAWLADADPRLRLAAARALSVVPDPRAVAPLGRVLADPDAEVREAAAQALGVAGGAEAARLLLGHLDDTVPRVRSVVVDSLARLGDPAAVVPLLGKVQDPALEVRRRVVRGLGELGDARAASSLLLAVQDADATVRAEALASLGRLRVGAAVPTVVAVLRNEPEGEVRHQAVLALGALGTDAAVDALVSAFDDPGPGVTAADLVTTLAAVGAGATARLERCLDGQPTAAVGSGCAEALGTLGGPRAVPVLTAALRRGAVDASAALTALGRVGDAAALPTILEHLASPEASTRRAAAEAALQLLEPRHPDGRAVGPIAQALAAAGDRAERKRLVALLGRTGAPTAVPLLEPLVGENDDLPLRTAAISALGELAPAGQDRVLLAALEDEDATTRWFAAVALWRCASGAAARAMLDRLELAPSSDRRALLVALGGALSRNRDPAILTRVAELARRTRGAERDALLEALGRASGAGAGAALAAFAGGDAPVADRAKVAEALSTHEDRLTTLRKLGTDPDGAVRANAVWSLGAAGVAADVQQLAGALSDPDVAVAANAAAALARLARRTGTDVAATLCTAIAAPRAYVRANALAAAALVGARCATPMARRLLLNDPSPIVRRAAAGLLWRVPSGEEREDRAVLDRCTDRDRDGAVAVACAAAPAALPTDVDAVLVYVVPAAEVSPVARAPYALVLSDGLMRLGVSDRRGAVFEARAPRGPLTLEVPAPLAP